MLGSRIVRKREPSACVRAVVALLAALCAIPAALAQVSDPTRTAEANNYPTALPRRKGPPPARMAFELIATIPLPGRLSGEAPIPSGATVRVPLEDAIASSALSAGATAVIDPASEPGPDSAAPEPGSTWVVAPGGARRFRTLPAGRIESEKRCRRCDSGWKRDWSLNIPGATPAPPIARGRRLFFGARDDRVYCLRADNGHRVWAVDVGDRVSRPIAVWVDPQREAHAAEPADKPRVPEALVLVAPDGGGVLLALDPYDGARIASFELPPAGGRLATPAVASAQGAVVIGREKYSGSEADLFVFALGVAPAAAPEPAGTTSRDKLGGLSGKETSRGEDGAGESEGPRPDGSARAPARDAPVAQDR